MTTLFRGLSKLNWTAAVISPIAVILMEVLWVYPWLAWTREFTALNWQRVPLRLASLIFLIGIPFLVTRFFRRQRWGLLGIQLSIMLVTIFMVVSVEYGAGFTLLSGQWFAHVAQIFIGSFFHLHPITPALIASVYLCWRGIRLGHSSLYFADVYPSFLFGLAALVLLIVVWTVSLGTGSLESLTSTVGLHVAGFFFFGLTALALGNLQAIRRKMIREEMAPPSNRRWVAILLGVVGGIVLLGIGIASIFSPGFVAAFSRFLGLIIDLLSKAMYYLLIPLNYLAEGFSYAVLFMISLVRGCSAQEPFETPPFLAPEELPVSTSDLPILKWIILGIIIAAVLFLLAKAISRFRSLRAGAEVEVEEISESLWSWQGFMADLRLFLSTLLQRWRRKRMKPAPSSPVSGWHPLDDLQDILDIREIYRHLLWEASNFGIKHWHQETPYEYARRLGQALPDSSDQLGELTNLYIDVRYGDLEVEDGKLEHANSLWRILRRLLRGPEKEQQA